MGAFLFALHLLFCQAHLLAEHHHLPAVGVCPAEPPHTDNHDHPTHSASDHELQAGAHRQTFIFTADVFPPTRAVLPSLPPTFPLGFIRESDGMPVKPPPDPAPPRAPPFA